MKISQFFISFALFCIMVSCKDDPVVVLCEDTAPSIARFDDYHPDNFFYKQLPSEVVVKENSDVLVNRIVQESANIFRASVSEFAEKVYYTDASTPRRELWSRICNYANEKQVLLNVPVPNGATPANGTDEQITFIDTENNLAYNFQAYNSPAAACPNIFGCYEFSGISVVPIKNSAVTMYGTNPNSGFGGAGILGTSGAIWPEELLDGYINHALRASFNLTATTFIDPAIKSDGTSTATDALPMGTLLQLSPLVDLTNPALGLSESERIIAKAMQDFGIYICDTNGAGLAVKGIAVQSYDCNPYKDYKDGSHVGGGCPSYTAGNIPLNKIPLDSLRVIEFPHTFTITQDVRNVRLEPCWKNCN